MSEFLHNMHMIYNGPYPELNEVLRVLVKNARQILGSNFIGAYLQGSFAVGDFDEHSDADFIIVIDNDLTDFQLQKLQAMHRRIFNMDPEWAKHLEGSYFPKAILRDYTLTDDELWYLDNGHSDLVRSHHCNTVIVRWILQEKGVVLLGSEPSTLIDPIPVKILRRTILFSINNSGRLILDNPERFDNRFYQGFIVLHWCRKLHDLYTGTVGSKRSGAAWAKRNMNQKWAGLIDRAWDCRPDPAVAVRQPANETDFQMTLEFVKEVMKAASGYAAENLLTDK